MEIIFLRGYNKYLGISLMRITKKNSLNMLIKYMSSYSSEKIIIQLLNPCAIAGIRHIVHATRLYLKALGRNRIISKQSSLELLLYLVAKRQIRESIKVMGVTDTFKKVILVGLGTSKDKITRSLQHIIQSIGDELSVALIGKEGIADQRYIMDTFSITNLEIDSHSPKSEADLMELLEKFVIERIALFAI